MAMVALVEAAPAAEGLVNWECPDPRSALRSHIQQAVDGAAINELDNNATGLVLPKQRAFEHAARGEVGGAFTSLKTLVVILLRAQGQASLFRPGDDDVAGCLRNVSSTYVPALTRHGRRHQRHRQHQQPPPLVL